MKREIVARSRVIEKVPVPIFDIGEDGTKLKKWLVEQIQTGQFKTLLAHADDGVIWGVVEGTNLHLSGDQGYFPGISPQLNPLTLQECRLFGPTAELHLWRDDDYTWQARLIRDEVGTQQGETLDEEQILWGTKIDEARAKFTLVSDGSQENRHAPPLALSSGDFGSTGRYRPLRLQVRHYLASEDETGLAHIHLSRLVALRVVSPEKSKKEKDA